MPVEFKFRLPGGAVVEAGYGGSGQGTSGRARQSSYVYIVVAISCLSQLQSTIMFFYCVVSRSARFLLKIPCKVQQTWGIPDIYKAISLARNSQSLYAKCISNMLFFLCLS